MAGVKISDLPAITNCALGDIIPEVQPATGGTTYKATMSQVLDMIETNISIPVAQVTGAAASGTNADITSMSGLTGNLRAPSGILSPAGANFLEFNYVSSAVNYLQITNNVTGQSPGIQVIGTDSSIPYSIKPKNADLFLQDSTGTLSPAIRYYNAAANHYTALKVATAQATDATFTLPAADAAGFMISNGSGVLSLSGTATDISGSVTINGFSSVTTNTFVQFKVGKLCFIRFNISGTSNATTFTVTTLPTPATTAIQWYSIIVTNSSVNTTGAVSIFGALATFYNNGGSNASGWTASGVKSAFGSFWYETA